MKGLLVFLVGMVATIALVTTACMQAAPAPTPAKVQAAPTVAGPAKAAEPTKPAAEPTRAPTAQPTTAPAKKVDYPTKGKTITFIVAYPAGGIADTEARILAPMLERELGVPVVVKNVAGAGGQVAYTELAKSRPDGYTIGHTTMPSAASAYLDPARQAAYGRKDLQQVANTVSESAALAVRADSPYRTLKELVDAAKSKPGQIKVSDNGIQSAGHLALLLFEKAAGVRFAGVHFEGGAPSLTALLGGHVDANFNVASNFPSRVRDGSIRVLGVTDTDRTKFLPDAGTFIEQGYNISYITARGISVPAGTPREIVDILSRAVKKALDDPDVQKRIDDMFTNRRYMDANQYTAFWDESEAQLKMLLDELAKRDK